MVYSITTKIEWNKSLKTSTTESFQLDFFKKTLIPCKCKHKHVFTKHEYSKQIEQLLFIVSLIKEHGWNLSINYYCNLSKIDRNCNAWEVDNNPYLSLRGEFNKKWDDVNIPLNKNLWWTL